MTVSTLRPSSTSIIDGVVTGAANAHTALSDDSNASYITLDPASGATPAEAWFGGFTDLTLPAGALVKTLALRASVSPAMIPSGGTMRSLLTAAGYTIPQGLVWVNELATITGLTYSGGVSDSAVDAITAYVDVPHGSALRLEELYLDVTYVEQAVVSAILPTGTVTTTNLPIVEWSVTTDPDGGDPAVYQVRVFTDAQYGDAAFNPYTSTATVETESPGANFIGGSGTQWQVTDTLPDDTYRAYVRVAQNVNGGGHWSEFDYVEFTVDVDLPAVPTLVPTADSANGRFSLTVSENAGGAATTDRLEVQRSFDAGVTWEDVRTTFGDSVDDMPYVVAEGTFADAADGTSHAVPLPAPVGGIQADDLLIAFAGVDGNPSFTWPAGWTEILDQAGNGSAVRGSAAWKRAAGGEQGSIAVTTSASEGGGFRILCIRGAYVNTTGSSLPADGDAPAALGGTTGSAANTDPGNHTGYAGWIAAENFLWIAALVNDGNVAVTAAPSGYTNFGNTRWANAAGAGVATAVKRSLAFAENPGAWTHTAEDTLNWMVQVRPRNAFLTVYDYEVGNGESVRYRARSLHDYNGEFAASSWVGAGVDSSWSSSSWWLKHPHQPDLNVAVTVSSQPSITRASRAGVFQPLGATYAVVVSDTRGPKTGGVTLRALTEAEQDAIDALLDTDDVLLLQSPAGGGGPGYVKFLSHTRARIVDWHDATRSWEQLEFVVVPVPPGPVVEWPS